MNRLISSRLALETVIGLDQRPEGLRLADVAAILGTGPSSAQRALELLVSDGLVARGGAGGRLHRLEAGHPAARAVVALASRGLPVETAVDLVCRANPAVEFAGRDDEGYLLVTRRLAGPADEARLGRALVAINSDREDARPIKRYAHDEVRDLLLGDRRPRDRAMRMTVVSGSVDRSFPDRSRRVSLAGRRLGRLHPSLRVPSQRALAEMARRHHLARVLVFGSAVREDFRSDSDVDILIEPEPGTSLGLDDVIAIREQFEDVFGRDVDLLNARFVRPRILERAASEGVALHG